MLNFAITGVAGQVAGRHLRAITATGNRVALACDVRDSAGLLDELDFEIPFVTDPGAFEQRLRTSPGAFDWLSVCSPNDTHRRLCRVGLEAGLNVICEKPVALSPSELDELQSLEEKTGRRVWTVLQLRTLEPLVRLQEALHAQNERHEVVLTYVTARGRWYAASWKGDEARSGGIGMNIGVHMFDMLVWLFGGVVRSELHLRTPQRMCGVLELARARVRWFLSIDPHDLPAEVRSSGLRTFRSLTIDGAITEFSEGFSSLHTRVYERTLEGEGFGLEEARAGIELADSLRHADVVHPSDECHPLVAAGAR